MDLGVPPIGWTDPAAPGSRAAGARRPPVQGPDFSVSLSEAASGPPPELRAEMAAAARAYDALRAGGRELSFEINPETGRVVAELRDLGGNRLGTIPPSAVLELAAGARLP